MLVCNVSLRPPRTAISADVAEAATAIDGATTGNIIFAALVDEPALASDSANALLGEIMVEAASADAVVSVVSTVAVSISEAASSTDAADAVSTYAVAVAETATATDVPDASAGAAPLGISGTPVTTGIEYEHGVGSTYAGFSVTASGGTPAYTYSIASGTLPAGITLNSSTGAVSGTPAFQSAGTYAGIVIRVTDAASATADLASFTIAIAYKDPYFSSTKLLIDHNAADATTTFTDASSASRGNATVAGSSVAHDTDVTPPYGTSWYLFNSGLLQFADSNDWNLGTQNFTIDVVARPNNVSGARFWIAQWGTAGNLNFSLNQSGSTLQWSVSTTGSNNIADVVATSALATNTTNHFRLDYNGTKYRLYKDGVMIASSTTARSLFTGAAATLTIGSNSAGSFLYGGHMKGIRITVGVARTASDSGYTISNRALPTS